ncbi:MAG: protein-methionine-sulfoxide reductase heme-binding subunit MsrQ [Polyangiaceae bacterium]
MLARDAARGWLGANPVAEALNGTGELAIKLLLLSLACTPARIVTGSPWPIRARKHLGLLAFTYALGHFTIYIALDRLGALGSILGDLTERPFVIVGFIALLLLVPLAITSTKRAVLRLGGKRWNRLHKLVYVIAVLAVVHFTLRAKKDVTEAAVHGAILAVLLSVRGVDWLRKRARRPTLAPLRRAG